MPPAGPGRAPAGPGPRRLAIATAAACLGLAAVAGCSSASPPSTTTAPTARATAAATTAPPTTPAASTPAASPSAQAPASPPTAVPTLGQPAGDFAHGTGFGQVKPARIFNGGDPTGLVTHVVWTSWGGAQAVATGVSDYVGPGQSVATGTEEPVTVTAFDLGTCDGKLMYQAVEWYFPQHGQAFDAGRYQNICTGSYVPGQ